VENHARRGGGHIYWDVLHAFGGVDDWQATERLPNIKQRAYRLKELYRKFVVNPSEEGFFAM